MNHNVGKFRAWGLLALPLVAVVVVALMLAWGHGSSQQTEAVTAVGPDLSIAIDTTGDKTPECSTKTPKSPTNKCNVNVGDSFTVFASVNALAVDGTAAKAPVPYAAYSVGLVVTAGLSVSATAPPPAGAANTWPECGFPVSAGIPGAGPAAVNNSCAVGVPPAPQSSTHLGNIARFTMTCDSVVAASVTMVHGAGLSTSLKDTGGNTLLDPDGLETVNVNCLPPAENINVTIQNAQGLTPLSGTCVLVSFEQNNAPPQSPPVIKNIPFDVVSDNNANAVCEAALPGPLSDSNPAVGVYEIAISGALRLQLGDVWHVQQVLANEKFALDPAKLSCDLSLGKCTKVINNQQVTGTITANFFVNPPGGAAPVPLVSADGIAENCVSIDGGAAQCETGSSVTTALLPVGAHTAQITSCENGLVIDEKGGAQPALQNVTIGFPTKQPKVEFHCASPDMFNLKEPGLSNLFLTAQSATKLEPSNCAASDDVATFSHFLSNPPAGADPKGLDARQVINAFELEVWFDEQWICVNIDSGQYVANNGGSGPLGSFTCLIDDKNQQSQGGPPPQGLARIGCVFNGKLLATGPSPVDESSMELAVITVRPQPELYSQLVANQDNGIPVQLLNKGCNLADQQGHPIVKLVAGLPSSSCDDSALTIRFLEGDVNADCRVNAADQQILAFRWGASVGSLLYNSRFDLQPSGTLKFDGDIDIKDLQFVFGRHGSTCGAQNSAGTVGPEHPPQPAVNPKLTSP